MAWDVMCPKFESAMGLLAKRWTGLIIRVLLAGPRRFREIQQQIPAMSDRLLSERLKELEMAGVLERNVYPETPVRIEYRLTAMGRDLEPVVAAIQTWAERWHGQSLLP